MADRHSVFSVSSMTIQQMKDFIKYRSSVQFGKRVDKMPDSQIIAIYHRMLENERR